MNNTFKHLNLGTQTERFGDLEKIPNIKEEGSLQSHKYCINLIPSEIK